LPIRKTYELLVAQYRDYEVTVSGSPLDWEFWIQQGKWNLAHRRIKGRREAAQKAARDHLFSLLSKTEKKRYKAGELQWRDWLEDTMKDVARTRDRLAGRRSRL